jgi:nucleoside-diphosphate-sugar epimerase
MRILVTGGAGYIGSVMTLELLAQGFHVRVLDSLIYGHEGLLAVYGHGNFQFIKGDIRDPEAIRQALEGIDAVIHLAAIVGEPLCKIVPQASVEINRQGTVGLLKAASFQNVARFIFASTCSNYGISSPEKLADEETDLHPLSLYAETKVAAEYVVLRSHSHSFATSVVRFATVYGVSPHMRFDLLLHEFIKDALETNTIELVAPDTWRPLLHVRDAARAVISMLRADASKISGKVFNIGNTDENYTKLMIAKLIQRKLPRTQIKPLGKIGGEPRNYRVSFEKAKDVLGFRTERTLADGVAEVVSAVEHGVIDPNHRHNGNLSARLREFCVRPPRNISRDASEVAQK